MRAILITSPKENPLFQGVKEVVCVCFYELDPTQ